MPLTAVQMRGAAPTVPSADESSTRTPWPSQRRWWKARRSPSPCGRRQAHRTCGCRRVCHSTLGVCSAHWRRSMRRPCRCSSRARLTSLASNLGCAVSPSSRRGAISGDTHCGREDPL